MLSRRRDFLAGTAGVAVMAGLPAMAQAKPRVTVISQWCAGSDGAAITALGKRFEEEGGVWQHNPVPGFTTEMMNKLRAADHRRRSAGRLAAQGAGDRRLVEDRADRRSRRAGCSRRLRKAGRRRNWRAAQAGGPLDRAADAGLSHQHAVPVAAGDGQGRRTKPPATWAEFNELADEDEGRRHHPGRQRRHPMGRRHEVGDRAGRHQPRRLSRARSCSSTPKALKGPEVLAAFAQTRKIADWMDPDTAASTTARATCPSSSRATWACC